MTNGEYKRLTTGGYVNPKLLREYRDRLYELETAIENGMLMFLPYKVGDSLWHIQYNLTIEEAVVDNIEVLCDGDTKIRVHFVNVQAGTTFYGSAMGKYYFTSEEAAKKALEELKKC